MEGGFFMKRLSLFIRSLSVFLSLLLCVSFVALSGFAAENNAPAISYGVSVLASRTDVAVCAPAGNEVVFSQDVFARGLNLSSVDYITVLTLPDETAGQLLLGSTPVARGQKISAQNLSHMVFSAAGDEVKEASFSFEANGNAIAHTCRVYLLSSPNYTPTLSMVPRLSLEVLTYRDMNAYGTLGAYDPDGDALVFEIVSYPQKGAVVCEGDTGSYVYTPNDGYVGNDSFSYVARDIYGNYSAAKTVNLRVEVAGTSVVYADMEDSPYQNAALSLTAAGVMSGVQMGNKYYFYPEKTVTRAEFLVMAMHAAGITDVPDCTATAFSDDADIPKTLKGYVAAAYSLGYVSGTNVSGELCFLPNEAITRAQAAVMVGNIVGECEVSVLPVFADHTSIPVWASDAIYSLHSIGILTANDGCIDPVSKITREQSAQMLAAIMQYTK